MVRKQRAELCAEQRTEFEWSEGACRLCGHCGAKIHPVSTTTKKYRKWGWWKNSSKSSSSGAAPTAEDAWDFSPQAVAEMSPDMFNQLLLAITAGSFAAALLVPAAATFSRAVWANPQGPGPVRSREFPRGFPWI